MNFYNSIISDSIYYFKNSIITRRKKLINDLSKLLSNFILNKIISFDDFTVIIFKQILNENYTILKRNNKDTSKYKWIKDDNYLDIDNFEIKLDKILDYHIFILESFLLTLEKDSSFYLAIGDINFNIDELINEDKITNNLLHSNSIDTDYDTDDSNSSSIGCLPLGNKKKKSNNNINSEDNTLNNDIVKLNNKKISLIDLENKLKLELEELNKKNKYLLQSKIRINSEISINNFKLNEMRDESERLYMELNKLRLDIKDKDKELEKEDQLGNLIYTYDNCKKCNIEIDNLKKYIGLIVRAKSKKYKKFTKCIIKNIHNNFSFKVQYLKGGTDIINIYDIIFPHLPPVSNSGKIDSIMLKYDNNHYKNGKS